MTETDELRRLLDERGVEWTEEDGHTLWWGESTHHRASAYSSVLFGEDGRVYLNAMVTPEQAIAATLGNDGVERTKNGVDERGTCRMERANWDDGTCTWGCICSACGKKFEYETGEGWNYCPKCGAEVVE